MFMLYNPDGATGIKEWCDKIGSVNGAQDEWTRFGQSIQQVCGVAKVGLLRQCRGSDVDDARVAAKLNPGYFITLCDFLTPEGCDPFVFTGNRPQDVSNSRRTLPEGLCRKKFESQRDRPSLGHELGPEKLADLELPDHLTRVVKWSKGKPMPGKGPNSCAHVVDVIYEWAFAKWGNAHVDSPFCDRMEQLLSNVWPDLQPWGKSRENPRPRRWSHMILNRFSNVRQSKAQCPAAPPS